MHDANESESPGWEHWGGLRDLSGHHFFVPRQPCGLCHSHMSLVYVYPFICEICLATIALFPLLWSGELDNPEGDTWKIESFTSFRLSPLPLLAGKLVRSGGTLWAGCWVWPRPWDLWRVSFPVPREGLRVRLGRCHFICTLYMRGPGVIAFGLKLKIIIIYVF